MNKKKILSMFGAFLMVICMMLSLMPVSFLADQTARQIPENAILISTPEELLELAENCQVDSWSVGKTVVLNNDIDLLGYEFHGIPTFGGTFIGKGFTVKGIHMDEDGSVVGFFRYLQETAVVENLKLEGNYIPSGSGSMVGAIAGKNAGVIENCTFKGNVSGKEYVGGLVGVNETTGLIDGCSVSGIVYGNHFVGGAAGANHGVIRNTTNYAQMNTLSVQNSVDLADITMDSLLNTENASTTTDIGGIAGNNSGVIRNCTNNGPVGYQHMGYNIGGIAGTQTGYVVDCVNNADIQGRKEVGGIVGHMEPNMVLDYDKDSLQILSGQMEAMENTMSRIEREVENGGNNIQSQVDGLQGDLNQVENALDALSNSMDLEAGEFDADRTTAAVSDLSSALSNTMDSAYTASQGISDSMNGMSSNVMSEMETMISQLGDVMVTMNNIQSGIGFELNDISGSDTEEDTLGKVATSVNYGTISGDLNIGGIAGMMAQENDLDEDVQITGELSLNANYDVRVVIRDCSNYGTIETGKQSAGGIVGSMTMGAVLESSNFGNLDALNADYVGGIAGDSSAIIRNCSSKAVIAGDCYVGGIAGEAKEVTDSYAFVQIAAATEKAGAIIGYTEDLPDGSEDLIQGNKYFLDGKKVGGIDGISYTGATDPLTLDAFLQIPDLNEAFKTVDVIFRVEGQADIVRTLTIGESLSLDAIPSAAVEEGEEYDWEFVPAVTSEVLGMGEIAEITYISEELLSNIMFDQTYEVSFDTKGSVISSDDRTEADLPILLAVGSFAKNTTMEVMDQRSAEAVVNEKEVLVNYQVTLSDAGVEKLHYYLADIDGESVKLLVKDTSGNWTEREFIVDGSYIVFTYREADAGFALIEDAGAATGQIAVIGIIAAVVLVVFFLVKKLRKKQKK